jgi:hypothetical protein
LANRLTFRQVDDQKTSKSIRQFSPASVWLLATVSASIAANDAIDQAP